MKPELEPDFENIVPVPAPVNRIFKNGIRFRFCGTGFSIIESGSGFTGTGLRIFIDFYNKKCFFGPKMTIFSQKIDPNQPEPEFRLKPDLENLNPVPVKNNRI